MKKIILAALVCLFTLGISSTAKAVVPPIEVIYELYFWNGASWAQYLPGDSMPSGGGDGGQWKYVYTVSNNHATPVDWWHVLFQGEYGISPAGDPEYQYVSLSSPTGWTATTEDLLGSDDWFWARWEADASGAYDIPSGGSLNNFDVVFNYYGTNLPGTQHFQGGNGFSYGGSTSPVPEPASMLLFGMGILGLLGLRKRAA